MSKPLVHNVTYGAPGSGKSTFAATFPKPMVVLAFDPLGKEGPYLKKGIAQPEVEGDQGQPCVDILSPKGTRLIRIEYYHDSEPDAQGGYKPIAFRRFLQRQPSLYQEIKDGTWRTVVMDTLTFMELTARKLSQYDLDRTSREPRRWFAAATDMLEESIMCRLGGLRCNVVVLAHVDSDKDEQAGSMVFNPSAPGRLRSRLGGGYAEVYAAHMKRDDKGVVEYVLQTRADRRYNASSVLLEAPDPCVPSYAALFANYVNGSAEARAAEQEEKAAARAAEQAKIPLPVDPKTGETYYPNIAKVSLMRQNAGDD